MSYYCVECFEEFRRNTRQIYKLNLAWTITIPSYAFSSMLKYTKVELELLTDYDQMLFVQNGIRGGLPQILVRRHSVANNPYVDGYDKRCPRKFILMLDANS